MARGDISRLPAATNRLVAHAKTYLHRDEGIDGAEPGYESAAPTAGKAGSFAGVEDSACNERPQGRTPTPELSAAVEDSTSAKPASGYGPRRVPPTALIPPEPTETGPAPLPTIEPGGNRSPVYLLARRAIDVAGATLALVLFAPIMLAAFVILLVITKGRPLFRQERIGLCGRPFTMYKFRTMSLDAETRQHQVANERSGPVFKNRRDPRVTPFGRLLRAFSIDEMPQLINVLRGEMSLVGPRPPIRREVEQYTPAQLERLSVKPGLTCFWQVSGRAELDFEQQVWLDKWYVHRQGLGTDLRLLLRTPLSVLSRRGAF